MKIFTIIGAFFTFLLISNSSFAQRTYWAKSSATGTLNWNATTSWVTTEGGTTNIGTFPKAGDIAIIEEGKTITVNTTGLACASLQIGSSVLTATATADGLLTFSTGASLTVSGAVTIGVASDVDRKGTITFASNSTLTAKSVTLGATGTTPGTGTIVMTAGGTLSTDSLAVGAAAGTWTPGTGTVVLTGQSTLPASIFTKFNNLTVNASTNTVTSSLSYIAVTGTLDVASGTLVFSATNGSDSLNNFTVASGATFTHNVYWDTTSKEIFVTGNVAIDGAYNYQVPRCHLQMGGTTETIHTGTSALSIFTITNGAAVTANGTFTVNDNFWAPESTTGSFTTGSNTVTANATLLISASGTGSSFTVSNGGVLNVSGGIAVGYNPSPLSGTLNLQTGGTINTDFINIGDIGATGNANGTFNQQNASTLNVSGTFIIHKTPTASQYICTGTNATTTLVNVQGSWLDSASYTSGTSTVVFNGGSTQVIGGTDRNAFYNLTVNNSAANVSLQKSITVSNTLNFVSGLIVTGADTVIIPTSGSVTASASTGYVDGLIQKQISTGNNVTETFEIGDDNSYAPVSILFSAVKNSSTGYVLAKTTGTDHPNIATSIIDPNVDANRYWTLTDLNVTFQNTNATFTPTFNFVSGDLDANTVPTSFVTQYYSGSAWASPSTSSTSTGTTTTGTSFSTTPAQFGDFAVGDKKGTTTTSVISSLNPACSGSSVTFTATVMNGSIPVTVGNVSFKDAGTTISGGGGNIALNSSGQATFTTSTLSVGSHTITAVYNATTPYLTSTSATLTQVINGTPTATAGTINAICATSVGTSMSITTGASETNASAYTWTTTGTGTIVNPTSLLGATYTPTAADTTAGSVSFTLRDSVTTGGCGTATSTKTLLIHPTPLAGITVNYCLAGGGIQLTSNSASSYTWNTGATAQSINASILGTYTVTMKDANGCTASASFSTGSELITNGNFSSGNTGFTSSYTYTNSTPNGLQPEGLYAVGTNANNYHPQFFGTDHTTGTGNFMIVNGGASLQNVWSETLTVTPNTSYFFSGWAMSMNTVTPYAVLQFSINGSPVGSVDSLTAGATSTAGPFVWTKFYGSWNSGSATTAALSIVDLQTAAGGNDFGLDDIMFNTLSPATMTTTPLADSSTTICAQTTLDLTSNVSSGYYPLTFTWTGPGTFSSTSQNPTISNVTTANSGTYNLTVTDARGCTASGSIAAKVYALPVMTSTASKSICTNTAVSIPLTSDSTATYTWIATANANVTGDSITLQSTSTLANTLVNISASAQNVLYTVTPTATRSGCVGTPQIVTVTVTPPTTIVLKSGSNAQTVCINTVIGSIVDTVANATAVVVSGLPTGVNGIYSSVTGLVTISGTPSQSGTFKYYITTTGTCTSPKDSGTLTINPATTVVLKSGSNAQTVCINTVIGSIVDTVANATAVVISGLPTGVNGIYSSVTGLVTISGTPSQSGTFKYYITTTGTCTSPKDSGTLTVNPATTVVLKSGSKTQTVCINTVIGSIVDTVANATAVVVSGLPTGVNGIYSSVTGLVTISGTPSQSGTFKYYITTTGTCTSPKDSGTVTVNPATTVVLKSGSNAQTVCINTVIGSIVDTVANATAVVISGLPTGVNGIYSSVTGLVTISGTPSQSGTFKYYITTTGTCTSPKDSGTLTINPATTVVLKSGSNAQTVCINTVIGSIVDTVANATAVVISGLPTGVNGIYSSVTGLVTISGTPSQSGTFKYYITTTGTCTSPKDSGTLTVNPATTVVLKSGSKTQTVCINTAIGSIVDTVANATAVVISGLPTGVNGIYSSVTGLVTISGTPSQSGTFKYYITTTGTCTSPKDSGTLTVNPATTVVLKSGSKTQTVCINTVIGSIVDTVANATAVVVSGLPTGVNGIYSSVTGLVTISGTPSQSGTFKYYITTTGTCTSPKDSGTLTVNPATTVVLKSGSKTQTVCINTVIGSIVDTVANATAVVISGLPTGVNGIYSSVTGLVTISGTPSQSGTFKYYITTTGTCTSPKDSGTLTINPATTVVLKSGSNAQTVCINTVIGSIVDTVANATAVVISGLPTGVNGIYSSVTGLVTISGTPSQSGTFKYYITTTGTCTSPKDSGTLTVNPATTVVLKSGSKTQTVCINTVIGSIVDTVANATAVVVSGLPTGVNGIYSSVTGLVTISGTPSQSGTFKYYITTTGTCTSPKDSGTLTVNPATTVVLKSGSKTQTVCINTVIGSIVDTVANATAVVISGLPTGVNGIYSSVTGLVTISGTPSQSGTFKYYITTTGTCTSPKDSGTITVNAQQQLSSVSVPSTCSGTSATVNLKGLVANSSNVTVSYSINGVAQTPVTGVNADASGNASFTTSVVTSANNGQTLQVTGITNGTCTQSFSANATLVITASGTWIGVNSNWNDASNWCGGVPTATTDVLISGSITSFPDLTGGIVVSVHSITILSGDSLTINNGTLQVSDSIKNSGVLDAVNGTIVLNGSSAAQTIDGSMFKGRTIENLTISNSNGVSLAATANDTLNVSGVVSFGNVNNTIFKTNNNLTLLSSASNTASVADVTNGGINSGDSITGKVIVQRFMPAHRAWRLMTAPVSTSNAPTISIAWQEGAVDVTLGERVNPFPGFGTQITGGSSRNASGVGNTSHNGFDAGPNSTSIYYFSGTGWAIPATTSSTSITTYPGYMLFVRGDRSTNLSLGTAAPVTTTILRPQGQLNIGTQIYNLTDTGYHVIGNPYASAINFGSISQHVINASNYYFVMDPLMTGTFGVGSFVTYLADGTGHFTPIPNPGVSSVSNVNTHTVDSSGNIESGTAFLVYSTTLTSQVTIKEQDKVTGSSNTLLFRPSSPLSAPVQSLRTNLYASDGAGHNNLMDGVLDLYSTSYSDAVNFSEDVKKVGNPSESISLISAGQSLTAEKRQPLTILDTVHYSLTNYAHTNYTLEFIAANLNLTGLVGTIKDSYTGISTPLNMNGTTDLNFSVNTSVPASTLVTRFMIVFSGGTVLPVTFTDIKAVQQNKAVAVQWQVTNELNIKQYEVEKSTDGINFTTVATVAATGNNGSSVTYNWLDNAPVNGKNYYRVESIDDNGTSSYTQIVNVTIDDNTPSSITVYPNPVTDGVIHLQMKNVPAGTYAVRVVNSLGQVIIDQQINHTVATATETISYDSNVAKGAYQIEVINPDNSKTTISVML